MKNDLLLTKEEMKAINDNMPSDAKYGDVFEAIAKAQRAKMEEKSLSLSKAEIDKLTVIDDDRIYTATVHGFGKEVKATNFTDEMELRRHEGAKQVAIDQLHHTKKQLLDLMVPIKG